MIHKIFLAIFFQLFILHIIPLFSGEFHYYIHDHLGNTRVVLNEAGDVVESYGYYPFGMVLRRTLSQPIGTIDTFTGKELDEEGNLDWYYFGARYYDARIARWMVVDPMADKFPGVGPFVYCGNNPLYLYDPDGNRPWLVKEKNSIMSAIKKADSEYYTKYGVSLKNSDLGRLNKVEWPVNIDVQVEGVEPFKDMAKDDKKSVLFLVIKEYFKAINPGPGGNSDPSLNYITGQDPESGGTIRVALGHFNITQTITDIIINDAGGKSVEVTYEGVDKNGKRVVLFSRSFTREQYKKWYDQMKQIRDEARNHEEDVDNN